MATNTPNYNLIKPSGTDPVNIADLNNNADIIDATLKSIDSKTYNLATQAQAQEGSLNNVLITPLRLSEALRFRTMTGITDFNDFLESGRYYVANGTITTNKPPGFIDSNISYLEVLNRTNNATQVQRLIQPQSGMAWIRSKNGNMPASVWNPWKIDSFEIATQSQALAGADNNVVMTPFRVNEYMRFKSLSGYSDLNDIIFSSRSLLNGNVITANAPFGFDATRLSYLEVLSNYENNIPVQVLYQPFTGRSWIRMRTSNQTSSAWTSWRRLDNEISTSTQAKAGTDDTTSMSPLKVKESINNSPISRYGTASGTNALIITATPLFDDLYTGLTVKFKNITVNTGNVTANVNSKGVKSVLNNDGTQIKPGKLKANSLYEITYDGTNFYLTKGGGEESPISKVTRGSTTISSSSLSSQVTLPQFNVNKSVVKISTTTSSSSVTGTSTANNVLARIVDNTTISFTRNATSINSLIVYWELIEYEDYVNVQKGISDLSATSLSVPISAVNLDKSIIYFSYDSSTNGEYAQMTSGHLNSSSELLFRRGSDAGINKISWFVVEIS